MTVHEANFSPETWDKTEIEGWQVYTNKLFPTSFHWRLHPNDSVLEFKVYHDNQLLGGDYHFMKPDAIDLWINDFIYNKKFIVWLTSRNLKIY